MKKLKLKLMSAFFPALLLFSLFFYGCKEICPVRYILELPKTPETWVCLLGEPYWRIEWIDPSGKKRAKEVPPNSRTEIEIPASWANPVTAWPFWPDQNLIPGLFKPAGAMFPFDVIGGCLRLSWETGPDTIFYWELINYNNGNVSRIPANFDWPRFRELFNTGTLREDVREDPWLVNWRSVAERTASGNFDTRRLVPEAAELKRIPVSSGYWYGASPFAKPLFFAEGETPVFPVRSGINTWFSISGILRVDGDIWVFTEIRDRESKK